MLEQLAEESAELTKAALKLARIKRKEDPTPVQSDEALSNLMEEYTDVVQCARELNLEPSEEQIKTKKARFEKRWETRSCGPKMS